MTRWMITAVALFALAGCDAPPSGTTSATGRPDVKSLTTPTAESAPSATAPEVASVSGSTEKESDAPRFHEITLASGTRLQLELKTAVASDSSHLEDPVRATLRRPVVVDGETVLPAGAELTGVVTGAEGSGRVKGRARVAYRFDAVRLDGERYEIVTSPISHLAPATKRQDATKIAIGAGAGAAVGALLGGGGGAAKGAAIGGAGGTGVVLATRGREVRLGPGADVSTRLTAPATIRVRVS